jgi:hypothetical protein
MEKVASPSLYRRLLGSRFDELPGALRRFHDASGGGRARGVLEVERGRGPIRNVVASLMGFPRAGVNLPVVLEVTVQGDRERWCRRFPKKTVTSMQWDRDQLLIERFGPYSFSCSLKLEGADMVYEFRQAWLAGLPLPLWFLPRAEGIASGDEKGWRVLVRIFVPGLGQILRYEGRVEPE